MLTVWHFLQNKSHPQWKKNGFFSSNRLQMPSLHKIMNPAKRKRIILYAFCLVDTILFLPFFKAIKVLS